MHDAFTIFALTIGLALLIAALSSKPALAALKLSFNGANSLIHTITGG